MICVILGYIWLATILMFIHIENYRKISLPANLDDELLSKANNKLYTPNEFNNALKNLNMASQFFSMYLNISSLSDHHLELYNLISSLKIKPNIIGISETRLQKGKQPITNISLPNYVYEHTPTESGKGGTLPYIDKSIKYKLCKHLNIFEKR